MSQIITLTVARLEDRTVPTAFGNPWPDAQHLTLSFAPDGTVIAGAPSTLSQTLDPLGESAARMEILRAFQTWAVNSNINIGVVADGGQDFTVGGAIQNDSRFGDVRIGVRPLDDHVLAVTAPFNLFGSESGNSTLNSTAALSLGGSSGTFDLYTIYLQEAGHVFGLDNNPDPSSVMYEFYRQPRAGLSSDDVANLQSLYGSRTPDQFEASNGNDTRPTASVYRSALEADITTNQDVDYYRFRVPVLTSETTVYLKAAGLSLLTANLDVLNSAGDVVATATASDPTQNDLTLNLSGLSPLTRYYVRVSSARSDVFGVGAYKLQIANRDLLGNSLDVVTAPLNNSLATAANLSRNMRGTLTGASDCDYYLVTAPSGNAPVNLVALVWNLDSPQLNPKIEVYDASGEELDGEVLTNDDGSYIVQFANIQPGADYYLKITSDTNQTGNFAGAVVFRDTLWTFEHGAIGTLSDQVSQTSANLNVVQSQQFHFVLSGDSGQHTGAAVQMTIVDSHGNVVFRLVAADGDSISSDVVLYPGVYNVQIAVIAPPGTTAPAISFHMEFSGVTDPIGVDAADTTSSTDGGPPGPGSNPPPPPPDDGSVYYWSLDGTGGDTEWY